MFWRIYSRQVPPKCQCQTDGITSLERRHRVFISMIISNPTRKQRFNLTFHTVATCPPASLGRVSNNAPHLPLEKGYIRARTDTTQHYGQTQDEVVKNQPLYCLR